METIQQMMTATGMTAEQIIATLNKKNTTEVDGDIKINQEKATDISEIVEAPATTIKEDFSEEETESKMDFNPLKCMARVWANGLGKQCSRNRIDGSDYCKNHGNKASICEDGAKDKKGLWLGRIDKPKPVKNEAGETVIEWPSEDKHEAIKEKMLQKKNAPKDKKAKKEPKKKKRSPSAYALFQKMAKDKIQEAAGEDADFKTRQQTASKMWKEMSTEDKKVFQDEAKKLKDEFKASQVPKGPQKPKRPMSAWLIFCGTRRATIKAENPELKMTDIVKKMGEEWKAMSEEDKKEFNEQASEKKKIYDEEMKIYKEQLPAEQPPAELFEDDEVIAAPAPEDEKNEEYDAETEGSDDDEMELIGFVCSESPYEGKTLGFDKTTNKLFMIVDDDYEFVGLMKEYKCDEDGNPDQETFVFDFDAVEED